MWHGSTGSIDPRRAGPAQATPHHMAPSAFPRSAAGEGLLQGGVQLWSSPVKRFCARASPMPELPSQQPPTLPPLPSSPPLAGGSPPPGPLPAAVMRYAGSMMDAANGSANALDDEQLDSSLPPGSAALNLPGDNSDGLADLLLSRSLDLCDLDAVALPASTRASPETASPRLRSQ